MGAEFDAARHGNIGKPTTEESKRPVGRISTCSTNTALHSHTNNIEILEYVGGNQKKGGPECECVSTLIDAKDIPCAAFQLPRSSNTARKTARHTWKTRLYPKRWNMRCSLLKPRVPNRQSRLPIESRMRPLPDSANPPS
jgi:hypothetical protein